MIHVASGFYDWLVHGDGYQITSGPIIVISGWVYGIAWWRRINCHAPWCFRVGKYPTADGLHKLCARHHPELPDRKPTLSEIHERHEAAK